MSGELHRNYRDPNTPAIDHHYGKKSLRSLAPYNWQETQMQDHLHGWINTKDTVFYHSIILGYGFGPIERRGVGKSVSSFIKDHCGAAVRFRAMAITAYERIGNVSGRHTWTSVQTPAYLAISAAISAIDALACVLWGVLFAEAPTGTKVPDLPKLVARLAKQGHPLAAKVQMLQKKSGFTQMREIRNQMVHRGYCALAKEVEGFALRMEKDMFRVKPPGFSTVSSDKSHPASHLKSVDLAKIMLALLTGLERWECQIAKDLGKYAPFKPFVKNGLVMFSTISRDLTNDSSPSSLRYDPTTEYTEWWEQRYKRRIQGIEKRARLGKKRPDDPEIIYRKASKSDS